MYNTINIILVLFGLGISVSNEEVNEYRIEQMNIELNKFNSIQYSS